MLNTLRVLSLVTFLAGWVSLPAAAVENTGEDAISAYQIQPGDRLGVSVWKEEDLSQLVIVRPDGFITFPLVGEIRAAGDTIEALRTRIADRLTKYVSDPVVTISVQELTGNTVYVLGQVNRPGVFPMVRDIDVMQALSLAGGTATYASVNNIKILRRSHGKLTAIPFEYSDVEKGKNLEQNILLKAGDVVVVP